MQNHPNLRLPYANYFYEALPTYSAEPYMPGPPQTVPEIVHPAPTVVHAPIPIMLGPQLGDPSSSFSSNGCETTTQVINHADYYNSVNYSAVPALDNIVDTSHGWFWATPSLAHTSTFPTPSELLVELAANDEASPVRGPILATTPSPIPTSYSTTPEPSENLRLECAAEARRNIRPTSSANSVSILPETAAVKWVAFLSQSFRANPEKYR